MGVVKSPTVNGAAAWVRLQGAWQRVFIFLLVLALFWSPIAAAVYLPNGWLADSVSAEIVALVLVYVGFLLWLPIWGRHIHAWALPFQQCGLRLQAQFFRDLGLALGIGVLGVFSLFGIETLLGWAQPTVPSPRLVRFVLEGLLMALAVGFAEEMLFRGWVLSELEQNYSSLSALLMNAVFFAATHFIKPWADVVRTLPQFFGLVVLGMALVWARRSPTGVARQSPMGSPSKRLTRLGFPIGLHAGLIWGYYIVNVGGLSEYTGQVPEWVTGIDRNPLAGLLGVILLSLIAWQFAKTARAKA